MSDTGTQSPLFDAEKYRPEPPCWWLEINETHLLHYGRRGAAEYWIRRRQMWEISGRLRVITSGIGELVRIGPMSKDDAEFARDHLIEQGADRAALKVKQMKDAP